MWHVGIDLHRLTVVIAAVNDEGNSSEVRRINCQDRQAILETMRALQPFRAVIEATGTYRWLYALLAPLGTVLLAHPLRLRAMVQRRSKTDKLDSQLLANLLRINQIPLAYIPPAITNNCATSRGIAPAFLGKPAPPRRSCEACWRDIIWLLLTSVCAACAAAVGLRSRNSAPSTIWSGMNCCCGWSIIDVSWQSLMPIWRNCGLRFPRSKPYWTSTESDSTRHCW